MLSDAVPGVTRVTLDEKKRNSARRDVLADTRGGVLVRGGVLGDVTYLLIRVAGFLYGAVFLATSVRRCSCARRCSWRCLCWRTCWRRPSGVLADARADVLADVRAFARALWRANARAC